MNDDETPGQAVAKVLQRDLGLALDGGLRVGAIVDPASFAQAWPQFGTLAASRGGGSLFTGTAHAQDAAVAPLLLPLLRADEQAQHALVEIAARWPAVIWFASTLPPAALISKLTAKLHGELAEGRRPITLRYFDPRVLPALLLVLDDKQQADLNSDIRLWWWLDRRNAVCSHEAAFETQPSHTPLGARIAITEDQVQMLLAASLVDRVLDVLTRSAPDCLRPFDRVQRQEIAARHIESAAQWGLVSEFDCANYIAVSLQHGPDFANSAVWGPLMHSVKEGELRFSDAVDQWEAGDDSVA